MQKFLQWFCDAELYEEITGDLDEAFYERLDEKGASYAKRKYIMDVLKFFKPYAWKKLHLNRQHTPMFKNYFKIGLRNIIKRKEYALLNASGLILGLVCIFVSILYLRNELRYDTFYADAKDTYRVQRTYRSQEYAVIPLKDWWDTSAEDQLNYVNALKEQEEISHAVHFNSTSSPTSIPQFYIASENGDRFVENNILWTNSGNEIFDVFDWPFQIGNSQNALKAINSIVLSETAAIKYFGSDWKNDETLSKNLIIDSVAYTIDGVVQDIPAYSHLDFDIIVNVPKIPSWGTYVYITRNEGITEDQLEKAIDRAYLAFKPESKDDVLEKGVSLMPLTSIYLNSKALYELKTPGDIRYLMIFGIIGLIILIVTVTNYFNLSVALYTSRQKEVGVRKVLGAARSNTVSQFLFETLLMTIGCLPIAMVLVHLILPIFNKVMEVNLANDFLSDPILMFVAVCIATFIGLIAGLYPSITLSRKKMPELFRGKMSNTKGMFGFRRVLVGFQFILLIGLVGGTFFINKQLDFMLNKDLGYNKEGVVTINVGSADIYKKMKNSLITNSNILTIGAGGVPGNEMFNMTTYKMLEAPESAINDNGTHLVIDRGSMDVLSIDHPELNSLDGDKKSIFLINETAAKALAVSLKVTEEELIGKVFQLEPEFNFEELGTMGIHYVIDGIIEDYHYFTLKESLNPMFIEIQAEPQWAYEMLFKISADNSFEVLSDIANEYNKWHPDEPIRVEFLDDRLEALYKNESRIANLSAGLSTVAIILATLGLVGLVSYILKTKEREIGIRKVFGAEAIQIIVLLNKEFIILVFIAAIIAAPVTYWLTAQWLNGFAYHISPSVFTIVATSLLCLFLVVTVVSVQSTFSALKNPVDTLGGQE